MTRCILKFLSFSPLGVKTAQMQVMQKLRPVLFLLSLMSVNAAANSLPRLNIDPSQITVSGVSAGAYAAVQLDVAYSSVFSGAASIAGGVFGCAEGNVMTAQTQCMATPEGLTASPFIHMAKDLASRGDIDPLSNLASHRVYVFSGTRDTTVYPRESSVLVNFYKNFIPESQIGIKNDLAAAHGQPTLDDGVNCQTGGKPWILNCGYDAAGAALKQLYGSGLEARTTADPSHFHEFRQSLYASSDALLGSRGYIYIPESCADGKTSCALHVSLHGCWQYPENLGDAYRGHAGYNEWAESNNIVVLYPSATPSMMNPKGCFDWWGYTGDNYLAKDAPQMRAIYNMVAEIAGLN